MPSLRYLLLQTRNANDPMRPQEVDCFARALGCDRSAIEVFDLLAAAPSTDRLQRADAILLGGSGHYSAADIPAAHIRKGLSEGWLAATLEVLREIHHRSMPTFASCWGFQAMARAMGGRVIHDLPHAEIGTISLSLTEEGKRDLLFSQLPPRFLAQAGHEDHVVELPADAILLVSSDVVAEQAYRFADKPIYCTQFHPELDRAAILERVRAYPDYIERIAGISYEEFAARSRETPEANSLLRWFIAAYF
jgi:GMP synthase (glutamine-hydrolysing)